MHSKSDDNVKFNSPLGNARIPWSCDIFHEFEISDKKGRTEGKNAQKVVLQKKDA